MENERNQYSRDRNRDLGQETDRSKRDNRQNTAAPDPRNNEGREEDLEDSESRSTPPDNYERDSE